MLDGLTRSERISGDGHQGGWMRAYASDHLPLVEPLLFVPIVLLVNTSTGPAWTPPGGSPGIELAARMMGSDDLASSKSSLVPGLMSG